MTLTFDARIEGREICCDIGSDTAVYGAVFCCSLMAPSRVVSGGTLVRQVAGYTEVALPMIPAGGVVRLVLTQINPDFVPKNRAAGGSGAAAFGGRVCRATLGAAADGMASGGGGFARDGVCDWL